MKIQQKIISILLALRKSASETKGFLNCTKINVKCVTTFVVVVALSAVYFWSWYRLNQILREESTVPIKINSQQYSNESSVGCVFPEVNPYSKVALKYNVEWPKIVCKGYDWVNCNMSECRVTQHILDTMKNIVCYYKDIIHVHDHKYILAEPVKLVNDEVYVLNRSDYFKVSCTGYEKNGFGLIASRWHGYKVSVRPVTPPPSLPKRNDSLNILIVGFDSAARSGFILKLPKSYKVLAKELNAVVLEGYNIVGDGTPDALFPILSGRTELQHHTYARQRVSKNTYLDPKLFIFHTAKKDGYHTAYYEDMPWIGSFQYRYNGFSERPADHYLRSFFMEESKNGEKWNQGVKGRYCVGDRPSFLVLLDLTRQFMKVKGKRFCFTFIADISHDDFYKISTADDDLVDFLRHVKDAGYLEDTMLIVMGDHGPRFGPIRATRQGKLDERLPFMSIVLPEKLKRQRPNAYHNLKANAQVLTTPFDIHTTVLDALALGQHASEFVVPNAAMKRGLSLLEPIPKTRTCEEAEVTPHWCVCLNTESYAVAPHDPMFRRSVAALLQFINNITEEKRSLCAVRNLTSTMWVTRQGPKYNEFKSTSANTSHATYYQALVILSPGRAAFEASLRYDQEKDRFDISEKDISRISAYGTEPACVSATHPHLNKYCYCVVT
ncbi:uncharacterized protein [Maniola hyperantus]|uniref:uncharacterized protein n=1 Tax=Aphantopus hyperantus TaxID=2795564 RepID=UPI0015692DCF|nr:uncharacterized protein LOC117993814 isoform X1 [Maniola hyperantus]